MASNEKLGTEKIGKLLFRFSLPCVISLLISSLYNLVDQIFVGNSSLGYLGNAATGGSLSNYRRHSSFCLGLWRWMCGFFSNLPRKERN